VGERKRLLGVTYVIGVTEMQRKRGLGGPKGKNKSLKQKLEKKNGQKMD